MIYLFDAPLTPARADVYEIPLKDHDTVQIEVSVNLSNGIAVEFEEYDFWEVTQVYEAAEILPSGKEVWLEEEELDLLLHECGDDMASDLDTSDHYPGF